jgi:hypothetical protein
MPVSHVGLGRPRRRGSGQAGPASVPRPPPVARIGPAPPTRTNFKFSERVTILGASQSHAAAGNFKFPNGRRQSRLFKLI